MTTPAPSIRNRRPGRLARIVAWGAAILLLVYGSACAGLYWAMLLPPDTFGRIIARTPFPLMIVVPFESLWKHARAGRVGPGDPAPDFRLPTLDRQQTVELSSFRGSRPVVLVFGSYT